ncbi:MAG: N-formylglutamate amidohydrolase [Polyangiaceae bacterium]|nr:N-formylglutamate amidohydrolase [Polyangiaceae bacterium]MCW5791219.1 N-formylglutamate amidohydrolase [Polyangiaceae bacterium]
MRWLEVEDAYEVARVGAATRVIFSAEHASNRLPDGWRWPEADLALADSHWAWDPGVRELCLELTERLRTTAVLARFSRLLADPNRPEGHPELFRKEADGAPVALNQALSDEEIERRLERCYRPYHARLDGEVARHPAPLCFSIHSFTPVYQGTPRTLELGVLFNEEVALAESLAAHLGQAGYDVRLNEPYSGKAGLIYSIEQPARRHGRRALELEARSDLLTDGAFRSRLLERLAEWLLALRL